MRHAIAAGVLATGALVGLTAAQQTPTFRAGVEVVEVDVIVTDDRGQHVRDLKQEEFEIFEAGSPQAVVGFTRIDLPATRFDQPSFAAQPIEVDVASNEQPFDGRIYVMLVDDLSIGFPRAQQAKEVASQFVRDRLGANDLMAIVHTIGGPDASQDFTNNKRLLLASVEKTRGCKLPPITANNSGSFGRAASNSCMSDSDASRIGQRTIRALRALAEGLESVHGRRKAILLVSEGVYLGIGDDDATGAGAEARTETRAAVEALIRANASIYSIDPGGIRSGAGEDIVVGRLPLDSTGRSPDLDQYNRSMPLNEIRGAQDSLRQLSGETGGFAVMNMNDYGNAFARVVADNSAYYVLAFRPPDVKRDGKFHEIDVRVKRPGVTVRARRGYYAPKDKAAPAPKTDLPKNVSTEIGEALNGVLPSSGLGLRLSLAAFKAGDEASVLLTAEMPGRDLHADSGGQIELAYFAVATDGKVRGGSSDKLLMRFAPPLRAQVMANGFRFLKRLKLPPGRYQVRLAARNSAGGAVGSVIGDLEVPDYEKLPFSMSHLLIASAASSGIPTLRPDEETRTVLPTSPTARRMFPQNDTLALFAEIYDDGRALLHKVDIVTTIKSDDGKEMFKSEEGRESSELQGKRGGYGYTARIPLATLAPGRYVLAVEARSRLSNTPSTSRQIRINVGPPIQAR